MFETRPCFKPTYLLNKLKESFEKSLGQASCRATYSQKDCILSAFAMFHLKYPSLLQFEKAWRGGNIGNIKSLYGVENVPCDTTMRERLDNLEIAPLNQAICNLIGVVQRSQSLAEWNFMGGKLVSLDGTGFFSSPSIHCENCCEKHLQKASVSYSHQMLVGAIVSPYKKQVLPVLYEPICKSDGVEKNDCERNAAKRWLKIFRHLYPNMSTTIVEDGLASNAPHIEALRQARCHFILGAKPKDHKVLYDWFFSASEPDVTEFTEVDGYLKRRYRFMNDVPLNETHFDLRVNVLFLEEEELPHHTKRGKPKKKVCPKRRWLWVTDHMITMKNVREIRQGGRARWKIENETFNTLKNQDYHFEHNYGHGYHNLSNVLAGIMLLAFMVDQILLACNKEMQKALEASHGRYLYLWESLRTFFVGWIIDSLESLYRAVYQPPPKLAL